MTLLCKDHFQAPLATSGTPPPHGINAHNYGQNTGRHIEVEAGGNIWSTTAQWQTGPGKVYPRDADGLSATIHRLGLAAGIHPARDKYGYHSKMVVSKSCSIQTGPFIIVAAAIVPTRLFVDTLLVISW